MQNNSGKETLNTQITELTVTARSYKEDVYNFFKKLLHEDNMSRWHEIIKSKYKLVGWIDLEGNTMTTKSGKTCTAPKRC